MLAQDLVFLIDLVRMHTGIRLDESKSYLLESRLDPVLRDGKFESIGSFCSALRGGQRSRLIPMLVDAMTTNETSFFRDVQPFEHLADEVLPRLMNEQRNSKKLRIWSAACSSGQEATTLAIMIAERFPELRDWDVKILASDVSTKMVERCRSLSFTPAEMERGMPVGLRDKYFESTGSGWQASRDIRGAIETRQINLIEPLLRVERQDLILLRNVLIYFDESTRQSILAQMHRVLLHHGFLLLGTAEKPRGHSYERVFGAKSHVFKKSSQAEPKW